MMRTLVAPTEPSIVVARSRLSADSTNGTAAVLELENKEGIEDGAIACVGIRGNETAELVELSVVGGVVTADLSMDHIKGEPVSVLRYDHRRFYGADTETGTYSRLATVRITVDNPQGTAYEYLGTKSWFKATYYNSITDEETATTDSDAEQGDQSGRYATLAGIRARAGMTANNFVQDDRFKSARTRAESEMNSSIAYRYTLPLTDIPAIVTEICELLAAGAVMVEEYGVRDGESEGEKNQKMARSLLKDIREGTIRLIGADGFELAVNSSVSMPSFYPNALSRNDEDDPTAQKMPRNKNY